MERRPWGKNKLSQGTHCGAALREFIKCSSTCSAHTVQHPLQNTLTHIVQQHAQCAHSAAAITVQTLYSSSYDAAALTEHTHRAVAQSTHTVQ